MIINFTSIFKYNNKKLPSFLPSLPLTIYAFMKEKEENHYGINKYCFGRVIWIFYAVWRQL